MRAVSGAIQKASINPKDFSAKYETIGNAAPVGICGSGYIDLLAELLKSGLMDKNDKVSTEKKTDRIRQGEYGKEQKEITVPNGYYFFLGDNSINSQDGRYWGFADEKDIIGKAIFIWWPFDRIGMIE